MSTAAIEERRLLGPYRGGAGWKPNGPDLVAFARLVAPTNAAARCVLRDVYQRTGARAAFEVMTLREQSRLRAAVGMPREAWDREGA